QFLHVRVTAERKRVSPCGGRSASGNASHLYRPCDEREHQSYFGRSGGACCECPCPIFLWPKQCRDLHGGFIYLLNYYSGFDLGFVIAGLVWLFMWDSPNRVSAAANTFLVVTVVAAGLATFGVLGK